MLQHAIGLQILIHFAEVRFLFGVPARARDTPDLPSTTTSAFLANRPGCIKRRQRHDNRRGIASGIGDQSARLRTLSANDLGQSIDGFLQQCRRRVLESIPLRIERTDPSCEMRRSYRSRGVRAAASSGTIRRETSCSVAVNHNVRAAAV